MGDCARKHLLSIFKHLRLKLKLEGEISIQNAFVSVFRFYFLEGMRTEHMVTYGSYFYSAYLFEIVDEDSTHLELICKKYSVSRNGSVSH